MTEQDVLQQIRNSLAEIKIAGGDQATMTTSLEELDVDSLDMVEIVRMLEDTYGIEVQDEQLEGLQTIGDAVRVVQSLATASA